MPSRLGGMTAPIDHCSLPPSKRHKTDLREKQRLAEKLIEISCLHGFFAREYRRLGLHRLPRPLCLRLR